LLQFKKYHPSGNLKLNNLGIFQNLKLRILMKKSFQFQCCPANLAQVGEKAVGLADLSGLPSSFCVLVVE